VTARRLRHVSPEIRGLVTALGNQGEVDSGLRGHLPQMLGEFATEKLARLGTKGANELGWVRYVICRESSEFKVPIGLITLLRIGSRYIPEGKLTDLGVNPAGLGMYTRYWLAPRAELGESMPEHAAGLAIGLAQWLDKRPPWSILSGAPDEPSRELARLVGMTRATGYVSGWPELYGRPGRNYALHILDDNLGFGLKINRRADVYEFSGVQPRDGTEFRWHG
jgi:hypothetical protein